MADEEPTFVGAVDVAARARLDTIERDLSRLTTIATSLAESAETDRTERKADHAELRREVQRATSAITNQQIAQAEIAASAGKLDSGQLIRFGSFALSAATAMAALAVFVSAARWQPVSDAATRNSAAIEKMRSDAEAAEGESFTVGDYGRLIAPRLDWHDAKIDNIRETRFTNDRGVALEQLTSEHKAYIARLHHDIDRLEQALAEK